MIEAFRLKGGAFQVKLLEHWKDNRKNGLFEAYDRFGNKRYKDEYNKGLRTSHRIFDKDKTKSFDRKKRIEWCSRGTRTPTPFGTRSLVYASTNSAT